MRMEAGMNVHSSEPATHTLYVVPRSIPITIPESPIVSAPKAPNITSKINLFIVKRTLIDGK